MDLFGTTMLSTPFLLSLAGSACIAAALAMSWVISTRAQMQEADYKERRKRIPAAAADEVVVERLRLHREELKEIEARIAEKRNQFGEAERAEALAEHWQDMVRKLKADYQGLARERQEVEDVRASYVKAAADLAETRSSVEESRARIERLRREEEELAARVRQQAEAIAETADLDERLRVLKAELDQLRAELAAAKDERDDMMLARARLEDLRGQIEQQRQRHDELAPAVERLGARAGELKAEISELEAEAARRNEVAAEIERLKLVREELTASVERAERRVEDLNREVDARTAAVRERQETLEHLQHDMAALESIREEHRRLTLAVEELSIRRDELGESVERAERRVEDMNREVAAQNAGIRERQETLENLQRELAGLEPKRDEHRRLAGAVEELAARHRTLEAQIAAREKTLSAVSGGSADGKGDDGVDASLADLVRRPSCLFSSDKPLMPSPTRERDENAMLGKVSRHLENLGLKFDQRLIRRFHISLKTGRISPLTVLAGISGTGKSQLPQRYAEAMGIHFLKVPVQPRWDSPQDLFGFYNYLERRYKATEFARALVYMERHGDELINRELRMADRVLLVLLDEMNLARVEYYFSEFLSRLEGRPAPDVKDGTILQPYRIEIEVGADHKRHQSVYPGHNVLYVGTMNQDESTQALSDKVLDRANTIRFPRPAGLEIGKVGAASKPAEEFLPFDTWASWHRDISALPPQVGNFAKDFIQKLNIELGRLNRPFGHRVNQAILSYVANHPDYHSMAGTRSALLDMLEMRILPKLRGVEMNDTASSAFSAIAQMVEGELDGKNLAVAIRNCARDADMFDWTGMPQQ